MTPPAMIGEPDVSRIRALGVALREGTASATSITLAALRRIHELNDRLNAFVLVDEAGALEAAARADGELAAGTDRGPLHGIPVSVKDLMDVAGFPTTCGSASGFGVARAGADAMIVARLREAGAILVGKNTLHELAYGATGDRSWHGASRNPIDPSRMSGGSSGGSAAAVASGMVALAVGTDTVGSVRVPAALCGVVGFKPAFDALPTQGVHPCAPSLDHVGLLAAGCDDVAIAYRALLDPCHGGSPVRSSSPVIPDLAEPAEPVDVGWVPPGDLAPVEERIERATRALLIEAGLAPTSEVALPNGRSLLTTAMTLQRREAHAVHTSHLEHDAALIDAEVLERLRSGREVSDTDYAAAQGARATFRDLVTDQLGRHQLLALPTVAITAPEIGRRTVRLGVEELEVRSTLLGLTAPWNLARTPAISVPAGRVDGLPIGITLITAPGREPLMVAAGSRLEATQRARTTD